MKLILILSTIFSAPCEEVCDWPGHCLGEPCEFYDVDGNGCGNNYLCDEQSMLCVVEPTVETNNVVETTSEETSTIQSATCEWPGHCVDDPCLSDNDCDSDLVCIVAETNTNTTSPECDWPGHCLGEPCEFYDVDGNGCGNNYLCDEQSMLCVEPENVNVMDDNC